MTPRERMLAAVTGGEVDRRAVGNIVSAATYGQMRRTGFSFPEAHYDTDTMVGLAELSYTELGFDTVMPYFGLISGAAALGAAIDWGEDDWVVEDGRVVTGPRMPGCKQPPCWVGPGEIEIPKDFLDKPETKAILDAIAELRWRHPEACVVGKAMGPWTLSYNMFGVQEFLINVLLEPDDVHACLEGLKQVSVMFANAQIAAGADIVTLADHSTGDLVRGETYRDFLLPVHREIVPQIEAPVVLHCCGATLDRIEHFKEAGFAAFHFANENDPRAAKLAVGDFPLVGNVSNVKALMNGTPADVKGEVEELYAAGIDVISPECAVPMQAPEENLRAIVEAVEDLAAREVSPA
ncbi:MAG: uroporphyrinogen decarboxylase family protein [Chloroflexota bacterium]|nr:uroporphyrinogen decarboxylase family protein [Chloroflexota bacterium]MDP6508209.1 uroporphyrinogen decarboxylase family protein [Chloroflexota bacterium]MDP6757855.1 uroporphyrinogen decarboxylase family protein [Chloroflexota bacterium]